MGNMSVLTLRKGNGKKNILNNFFKEVFYFVSWFGFLGMYLKSVLNILRITEWPLNVTHQIIYFF